MTNFPPWKKIGMKNGYKQMMTVIAFLTFTVLLMFPPQNVFAHNNTPPSVQITTSTPTVTQNGQVPITIGTTVNVQFNFRGTDTDDLLQEFRCSWDGAPYAVSQCTDITSGQNTNSMNGYARRDLPAGSHTFGVKVVNNHRVDQHTPTDLNSPQRISVPVAPSSLRSFTVNPTSVPPSVRITGATTAAGVDIPDRGSTELSSIATTIPITFRYTGTRDATSTYPITGFRCLWVPAGGFYAPSQPYAQDSCPNMMAETRTTTGWTREGTYTHNWGLGTYAFSVQAFNSQGAFTTGRDWVITIRPQGSIDPSGLPIATVYKANSYNVHATTYTPALGINHQYHTQNGQVTPYDKMYIVFEAFYPSDTGLRSDILETGVRTSFECKWDNMGSLVPCGRYNFVSSVSPGYHYVHFRANNANGVSGTSDTNLNLFYWCVRPPTAGPDTCNDAYRPPVRLITSSDVRSYYSAGSDVSFYPGKNVTKSLKDLKEFPILNMTAGGNNQTISLKDLKEFPIINQTISANNTFQDKMIGTSTNATNVTSLGFKDGHVNKSGNESIVNGK